jgi:hypothetical protein
MSLVVALQQYRPAEQDADGEHCHGGQSRSRAHGRLLSWGDRVHGSRSRYLLDVRQLPRLVEQRLRVA